MNNLHMLVIYLINKCIYLIYISFLENLFYNIKYFNNFTNFKVK